MANSTKTQFLVKDDDGDKLVVFRNDQGLWNFVVRTQDTLEYTVYLSNADAGALIDFLAEEGDK